MAITSLCSGCGKTLAVADQFAGRQARCPQCGTVYTVPNSASPIPAAPTPAAPPPIAPVDLEQPIELGAPIELGQPIQSSPVNEQPIDLQNSSLGSLSLHRSDDLQLYWMRTNDGTEYGPADTATLARWFREGRVGVNYLIRQGNEGQWEVAQRYQPSDDVAANSVNPFASAASLTSSQTLGTTYTKSDQSGLVLAMGILTWIGFCPVFGLVAWVVGAQSLSDMQVGTADPTNRTLVQTGYYLGMINVILWACCIGFGFLSAALRAI